MCRVYGNLGTAFRGKNAEFEKMRAEFSEIPESWKEKVVPSSPRCAAALMALYAYTNLPHLYTLNLLYPAI